jgi:hypothetical protein
MIDPLADWPWPTFAELREILIEEIHCRIEPPPRNLKYSPRPITIFVRAAEDGSEHEWTAFHHDRDRLARGMVLNACRDLHIMLETLRFRDVRTVP